MSNGHIYFKEVKRKISFNIYLDNNYFDAFHSLMKIHIFLWHHFLSAWRTPFSNSYCTGLPMTNFLMFLYLKMSLFLFHPSRIFLLNIIFLCWQFFSFVTLKILFNCPLASVALYKKPAVIGIISPVWMLHFVWLLLRFSLSIYLF